MVTVTKGVENKPARSTPEPPKQTQVSTDGKDGLPADQKVSPEVPTITVSQMNAAIRIALNEPGRKITALEKERNQYKSQVEQLTSDLADNAKDIESLQGKYDEAVKDSPDGIALGKELKAARDERKQLKADKVALDAEKAELEPDRQERRNREIFEVGQEYELPAGATYDVLFDLADIAKAKTEAEYRNIADKLWTKKGEIPGAEQKKPADTQITTFSGRTAGGGYGFTKKQIADMPPEEYAKNREAIMAAQVANQIK